MSRCQVVEMRSLISELTQLYSVLLKWLEGSNCDIIFLIKIHSLGH
ncbi:MAG: hypothetical protein F6K54_21605 [Okeania sp. SIO3B5]|nr:hypothetical protein [Okeania sp. SIO3B5]NEO55434.1 hypothetical protein [Okeania sp. SIO3B5]